ncbi:MAG: TolC family protein, partial [Planctomycetes bacterium]|nr:TolC family protein [Planctomycetota bacterium]
MHRLPEHRRPPLSPAARLLPWVCLVLAACPACAPQARDAAPPVTMPEAFSATGTEAVPDRWWTALEDARLNALVDEALAGNLDLRVLWDRLDQSSAVARREGAALLPSVDATAGAARAAAGAKGARTVYASTFSAGLAASYEVDLWGRVRATVTAAELEARATREDLAAAAMTLAAEVAGTWYRLVDLTGQIALLDEQVRTNEKYLELVTLRFHRGKVTAVDVLQQRQLVEATRAERVLAESARQVLAHQLAILVGRPPAAAVAGAEGAGADGALPPLPPLPRTGLPADLIRSRPDVCSAFERLRAADHRVAAAVADRFPRISLSAGAETTAARVRDLFDNWVASLAANLAAPVFDGGRREAEVERTRAVASERLHAYGQAVLDALREVEDALVQQRQQEQYLASLERQLDLASKATEQTRQQYVGGNLDYLRVLTALLSEQRLQRTRLQARRELVQFRIDLYRA